MGVVSTEWERRFFVVAEAPRNELVEFVLDAADIITLRDE